MRAMRTILSAGVATLALAAAAYLPAAAMADTVDTSGTVVTTTTPVPDTTATPAPGRKLIVAFQKRAAARLHLFDADAAVLNAKLNRLSIIATRVHNRGGDVAGVRKELLAARADLALARAQAKLAAADLRMVPWATDRAAAQAKADAEFKTARQTLTNARAHRKTAATLLKPLAKQYHVRGVVARDFR